MRVCFPQGLGLRVDEQKPRVGPCSQLPTRGYTKEVLPRYGTVGTLVSVCFPSRAPPSLWKNKKPMSQREGIGGKNGNYR